MATEPLQHVKGYRSPTFNRVIDRLNSQRIVPGNGYQVQDTPEGTILVINGADQAAYIPAPFQVSFGMEKKAESTGEDEESFTLEPVILLKDGRVYTRTENALTQNTLGFDAGDEESESAAAIFESEYQAGWISVRYPEKSDTVVIAKEKLGENGTGSGKEYVVTWKSIAQEKALAVIQELCAVSVSETGTTVEQIHIGDVIISQVGDFPYGPRWPWGFEGGIRENEGQKTAYVSIYNPIIGTSSFFKSVSNTETQDTEPLLPSSFSMIEIDVTDDDGHILCYEARWLGTETEGAGIYLVLKASFAEAYATVEERRSGIFRMPIYLLRVDVENGICDFQTDLIHYAIPNIS